MLATQQKSSCCGSWRRNKRNQALLRGYGCPQPGQSGFTAYVTKLRMDRAAALLRDTDEKTYLIAEQTGYLDPNYFSYVFKHHFGMPPSKYRAGHSS